MADIEQLGSHRCPDCSGIYDSHASWCGTQHQKVNYEALRRVWQLLAGGYCPMCETYRGGRDQRAQCSLSAAGYYLGCSLCGFQIKFEEVERIEEQLAEQTKADLLVFENWRKERADQSRR